MNFSGLINSHLGKAFRLPVVVDVLVLLELGLLFFRNAFVAYHPVAWLVGAFILIYLGLVIQGRKSGDTLKLLFLGIAASALSIAIPTRTGEPILAASFAACGGMLGLYFVVGARLALLAAIAYLAYVFYYMITYPYPVGESFGYAFSGAVGITTVMLIGGVVLHHVLSLVEVSRQATERKARELERVLSNLRMSAGAGNLGIYSYSSESNAWTVNGPFRELFELPEQAYPTVNAADVLQRLVPEDIPFARERLANVEDQEPGTYQLQMPSGETRLITSMSQVIMAEDGSWTRHGIVYQQARKAD